MFKNNFDNLLNASNSNEIYVFRPSNNEKVKGITLKNFKFQDGFEFTAEMDIVAHDWDFNGNVKYRSDFEGCNLEVIVKPCESGTSSGDVSSKEVFNIIMQELMKGVH